MGIAGLYGELQRCGQPLALGSAAAGSLMVVDGAALAHHMWQRTRRPVVWGREARCLGAAAAWVRDMQQLGFRVEVVFDGGLPVEKREERHARQERLMLLQEAADFPRLLVPHIMCGLVDAGMHVGLVEDEADEYCVLRARQHPAAAYIVSQDSDYLVYDAVNYIPLDSIAYAEARGHIPLGSAVTARVYTYAESCRQRGGDLREMLARGRLGAPTYCFRHWKLPAHVLADPECLGRLLRHKYQHSVVQRLAKGAGLLDWPRAQHCAQQHVAGSVLEALVPAEPSHHVIWLPQFPENLQRRACTAVSEQLRIHAYHMIVQRDAQATVTEWSRSAQRIRSRVWSAEELARASPDLSGVVSALEELAQLPLASMSQRIFAMATRWTLARVEEASSFAVRALVVAFILTENPGALAGCEIESPSVPAPDTRDCVHFAAQVTATIYSVYLVVQTRHFFDGLPAGACYWGLNMPLPSPGGYISDATFRGVLTFCLRNDSGCVDRILLPEQKLLYEALWKCVGRSEMEVEQNLKQHTASKEMPRRAQRRAHRKPPKNMYSVLLE